MVTGIAIIAVIQHHTGAVDPGLVGLAISYALGITGKLSGLVSGWSFLVHHHLSIFNDIFLQLLLKLNENL